MNQSKVYLHKFGSWKQRLAYIKPSLLRAVEEIVVVLSLGAVEVDMGSLKADEDYIRLCFRMGWQP